MRIRIQFSLPGSRQVLPLNYQYPLSAWIYRVIGRGDSDFSRMLHEAGYPLENHKTFKLFTFSNLQFPHGSFRILKGTDRMEIKSREVSLIIAFMLPDAMQNFVAGLFSNQQCEIADRISGIQMQVANVEMLPESPADSEMRIRAISPVVVTSKTESDNQEQYLAPGDAGYQTLFFKNLTDKHHAWQRQTNQTLTDFSDDELQFRCLTEKPKSRLQTIKAFTSEEVKVRGYLFNFQITAPPTLIQTGLNAGFGAMNALGFGCGEVMINNNKTSH
jgi:CRISPR-associated endoribonuclease Cas6